MNLILLIEKFLTTYSNLKTRQEYRRKLTVFTEFLKKEMQLGEKNYDSILRGLDNNVFCKSVNFYISVYHIKSQSPVQRYLTVVSLFFKYIDKNYEITNDTFGKTNKFENLKISFEKTIKHLNKEEGKAPLSPEDFEKLRFHCENILNQYNSNNYFEYCSAIIIKITMLFGLKSNEIHKLKVGSHDKIKHKITINDYTLRLPDGLAQQLADYQEIRKAIQPYSKNEPLFVSENGDVLTNNRLKYQSMMEPLKHRKSECIAKRAIIHMLLSGITSDMVKNLTGFSEDACQECIDLSKEDLDMGADNRYFDTHLRNMELYDLL